MLSGIQRFLAVSFALGLGAVLAPQASASEEPQEVTVEVTITGKYSGHLCGFDWLGGYCREARPGKTETFYVYPRVGDPVWARVVPNRGGFDEQPSSVVQGDRVCFEAAGTRQEPKVQEVDCK